MRTLTKIAVISILALVATYCETSIIANESKENGHGLVGLRPLPRIDADRRGSGVQGASWESTPTYEEQKGNYPFVAEHLDTVMGWLDGDFKI